MRNTNSNNRIPELAQRDRPNGQRYLNLRPGSGVFAGKWISGQDGGEYSNLAMRPFDYLFGFQSDERVNRLINSSRGRWRTILPTNAIVGLQLMEISDGLNLAHSDGTPINLAPGQVLTLGTGADWVLNLVFWVADGAREGVYSVGFRLLDLNTSQGYTPLRDSGVFYLDFYVVPEPASLLALSAGLVGKDGLILLAEPSAIARLSDAQVLTAVYLGGVLTPCAITIGAMVRALSPRETLLILAKQVAAACFFACIIAWGGYLLERL